MRFNEFNNHFRENFGNENRRDFVNSNYKKIVAEKSKVRKIESDLFKKETTETQKLKVARKPTKEKDTSNVAIVKKTTTTQMPPIANFSSNDGLVGNVDKKKKIVYGASSEGDTLSLNKSNVSLVDNGVGKDGVLLCGIGKMENNYIREWVEHYKELGFKNICLFDNNDVDGERFEDEIGDYIESGFVILENARGFYRYQIESYNVCYNKYKDRYKWIAFFDIDEFLWIDKKFNGDINTYVSSPQFDKFNCIRVCWENYDDNDLITVRDGNYSCKERFTRVFGNGVVDSQSKAIIRTSFDRLNSTSPHIICNGLNKLYPCNSKGEPCRMSISIGGKSSIADAKLKHFRFKTIEEYVTNKMVRLWPTNYKNGGKDGLTLNFFFQFNKKTKEKEEFAKKLIESKQPVVSISCWTNGKEGSAWHRNWGDDINISFIPKLIDKQVKKLTSADKGFTNYLFIGSVLSNEFVNKNTVIWGSGIPSEKVKLNKPKEVKAVRGPLTRKLLLENGINCPEVYGDPALLIPLVYNPTVEKKYKIGIIPHFTNVNSSLLKHFSDNDNVKIINLGKYSKWTDIINEILSCEFIVSESLHGLIVAEAFNIPNLWINIENNSAKNKGYFKYHDFFLSLGKDREKPYQLTTKTKINDLLALLKKYERHFEIDLDKLIDSCPFKINKG